MYWGRGDGAALFGSVPGSCYYTATRTRDAPTYSSWIGQGKVFESNQIRTLLWEVYHTLGCFGDAHWAQLGPQRWTRKSPPRRKGEKVKGEASVCWFLYHERGARSQFLQQGLAVASIARDDPSTLPGDDPFPRARMHREQCAVNWDRNLKHKLAIMRQCTSVTDTDGQTDGHWHRSIKARDVYISFRAELQHEYSPSFDNVKVRTKSNADNSRVAGTKRNLGQFRSLQQHAGTVVTFDWKGMVS